MSLTRQLGRIPSVVFGIIYLLLIPFFAVIYSALPYHFYHSTAQFEPEFYYQRSAIEKDLEEGIQTRANSIKIEKPTKGREWGNPGLINVSYLKVDNYEVSFLLQSLIEHYEKDKTSLVPIEGRVRFSLEGTYLPLSEKDNLSRGINEVLTITDLKWEPLTLTPSDKVEIERSLFPFDYEKQPGEMVIMPIPWTLEAKLINLARAAQGFPSDLTGHFVRMFYLSAATITTVGYGDIIPLTTTARVLVSFEAILGIVIIGLFLNSLVLRKQE